jgi:hypothetical protein
VDPFLRRLERTAIVACLAMAVAALILSGGQLDAAVAVLAGGLLIGVSYWTIGSGVTALGAVTGEAVDESQPAPPTRQPSRALIVVTMAKVVGRYALLALLAYAMISRLRLHPVGLLAGASSVVAAASVEALRLLLKKS